MDMTLYGTGYGPAAVTTPSGEVLNGYYRLAIGGTVSSGYATVYTPRSSALATGTSISTPMKPLYPASGRRARHQHDVSGISRRLHPAITTWLGAAW